jgi:hypothetical protein
MMPPADMRILEIGGYSHCKTEYPERTTLLWTGWRPLPRAQLQADNTDCTPVRFIGAMRDLRAGRYDVVIAYMPQWPASHPRTWLRSIAHQPLHPFVAASRLFGVSWLRHVDIPVPLAVLDLSDAFQMGRHNYFLLDKADVVFKRELPVDRWRILSGSVHRHIPSRRIRRSGHWQRRLEKVRPLVLPGPAIAIGEFSAGRFPEKTVDVFFSGNANENSWVRRTGIEELLALQARGISVDVAIEPLPPSEFYRRMSRAWLAWSPEGFGWECSRTVEAAQCLAVPVLNYPTIERHRPLRPDEHAVFYNVEPGGLTRAIEDALADTDKLRRMAIAARDHVRAHHIQRSVVDHVIASALAAKSRSD